MSNALTSAGVAARGGRRRSPAQGAGTTARVFRPLLSAPLGRPGRGRRRTPRQRQAAAVPAAACLGAGQALRYGVL
ncbi:hypothetical protein [Streptomyces sp. NPDC051636]|uniref:hypothetical protein n=1 Tax=Streptomyces sp. NPDC051636 TaxID=3365663 RepID=UPI00379C3470